MSVYWFVRSKWNAFQAPIDGEIAPGDRIAVATRDAFGIHMTWRRATPDDPEAAPNNQLRAECPTSEWVAKNRHLFKDAFP